MIRALLIIILLSSCSPKITGGYVYRDVAGNKEGVRYKRMMTHEQRRGLNFIIIVMGTAIFIHTENSNNK